ncbi:hypothetical protein AAVH_40015, partial [Aphelenchoides avenae]
IGCGLGVARVTEDDRPKLFTSSKQQDEELFFRRLNNIFNYRLTSRFDREDLLLLYSLKAKADDLHCQIRTLFINEPLESVDYTLVDFLSAHLISQMCTLVMARKLYVDYATFFAHKALRDTVTHLEYE